MSGAGLCLALVLLFQSCKGGAEQAADTEAVAPVQTALAKKQSLARMVSADAVLYPIKQSSITPKISAPVRRFLVNRGDHVREGQLLAELENRDLVATAQESRALYDQSEAMYQTTTAATLPEDMTKARTDLESATQALEAAKRLYENRAALVREGALSQKLADDAKVALVQAQSQQEVAREHLHILQSVSGAGQMKSARDQVDAAKAHWLGAQAQVAYSEVKSPISGVVSDRPVSDGEMASSSSPLLTIVDISEIVARVNLAATDTGGITPGKPATIHSPLGPVEAKVWVVSPSVDPASTTVEVWIKARNTREQLKPGTTAKIDIQAESLTDAIMVPAAALFSAEDGSDQVMVVTKDSTAEWRPVKLGIHQDNQVQILSGLTEGEQVVTVGGVGLEDKAKVRVENTRGT